MKKVLSIVLSLAMVVCLMPSMAFAATTAAKADAAYSDTAGTACEGAVNVLSALGVVDGYTDGTYRPEQVVTRAEMAKLIVTALGVADYASATTSQFNDMSAAEWAIPYVEYSANLNIVNGYGNGKFGPNDTVTYEQAVTMIVRALGYTDECKEMNGTWPAIYVQKATALGLFTDVVNGGSKGADRGDVAIMLFNALELAEVYADGDGATNYKSGNTYVTYNGVNVQGVNMLGVLNQNGTNVYDIVTNKTLDSAVYDITEYLGALGHIYSNKDGDVIAVGDIKTTFLKGTFNADKDEFTADGTTYKIASGALSGFSTTDGRASGSTAVQLVNGDSSDLTSLSSLLKNKTYTIAAKVSGITINNIFSVAAWDVNSTFDMVDSGDIANISSNHKLFGKDFLENDNGDIDYGTFILEGVDSLDDIAEDNVVYVYYDRSDDIRKVEVGTETVEGTLDSFTQGSALKKDGSDAGKDGTIVIGGTSYKTSLTPAAASDDVINWTKADDDDSVEIGDEVKAYLTSSGKVYKLEISESASSAYALVLDYAVKYDDGKIVNSNVLNTSTGSKIKVLTAAGDVLTLSFKNKADVKTEVEDATLSVGDIITYSLNSAGEVKSVTIKSNTEIDDTSDSNDADAALIATGDPSKVSASGYYSGKAIASNAAIFTLDKLTPRTDTAVANGEVPAYYIDDDDAEVASYSSILDSDTVDNYGSYLKNNRYAAIVLSGTATNNNDVFGVVTEWTKLGSDDASGADYKLTMLVDGESKTYYYENASDNFSAEAADKTKLYALKTSSNGNITGLYQAVKGKDGSDSGNDNASYLGYAVAGNSGISFTNNAVKTEQNGVVSVASDAVYLKLNSDGIYTKVDQVEVRGADSGKYAIFFDLDTGNDADQVADIVLLTGTSNGSEILDNNGGSYSTISFEINAAGTEITPTVTEHGMTGGSYTYTVVSKPADATATVSNNTITVNKIGEYEIKATDSSNNRTVTGTYTVEQVPSSISGTLAPATLSVDAGATAQITVSGITAINDQFNNAIDSPAAYTYETSAAATATVSDTGLVTGVAAGTANITVKCGALSVGTVEVTVTAAS
jgi:hypothetical protein